MKTKDAMRSDIRIVLQHYGMIMGVRPLHDPQKPILAQRLFEACGLLMHDPANDTQDDVYAVFKVFRKKRKPLDIDSVSKQILSRLYEADAKNMLIFFQRAFSKLELRSFFYFGSFDCIVDDEAFVTAVIENATTTTSSYVLWQDEVVDVLVHAMRERSFRVLQNDDDRAHMLANALITAFPHSFQ